MVEISMSILIYIYFCDTHILCIEKVRFSLLRRGGLREKHKHVSHHQDSGRESLSCNTDIKSNKQNESSLTLVYLYYKHSYIHMPRENTYTHDVSTYIYTHAHFNSSFTKPDSKLSKKHHGRRATSGQETKHGKI